MSGCVMHEDSNGVAASTIKFRKLAFMEPMKKQCSKKAKHVQAEKHHQKTKTFDLLLEETSLSSKAPAKIVLANVCC